jgi:hypothetical protein
MCRKTGWWSRLAGQVRRRDRRGRRARSRMDRRRWRTRCSVGVGNWARGEHGSAPTDRRSNLKRRRRARPGEHPAPKSSAGSHGREGGTRLRHDGRRLGRVYDAGGQAGVEGSGRRCDDGTVQQRSADTARHTTDGVRAGARERAAQCNTGGAVLESLGAVRWSQSRQDSGRWPCLWSGGAPDGTTGRGLRRGW